MSVAAADVVARLRAVGAPALLPDGDRRDPWPDVDVLVPRRRWAAARRALAGAGWRYELGGLGLWRLTSTVSYGWDDGTIVHLHRGVPAAPLPTLSLRRLERRLWAGARPTPQGWLEPAPEQQRAYVESQAARPGFNYEHQRWTARAADVGARRRRSWQGAVWSAAGSLQRNVRPRRLATPVKALLARSPLLDKAPARCRFGDVELKVGARVFKPRGISEALLQAAIGDLEGCDAPVVVEVGTGSGALSLALAAARPTAEIHAVDLFPRAVRSARRDARRLGATGMHVYRGSLLDPIHPALGGGVDVVVANVPYVPPDRRNSSWEFAPGAVGGSGQDGLGLVRALAAGARAFLRPGGSLLLQMTRDQWAYFADELVDLGYRPNGILGGTGADIVVGATFEAGDRTVAAR
jgi:release factor glutamine methyltransferase